MTALVLSILISVPKKSASRQKWQLEYDGRRKYWCAKTLTIAKGSAIQSMRRNPGQISREQRVHRCSEDSTWNIIEIHAETGSISCAATALTNNTQLYIVVSTAPNGWG